MGHPDLWELAANLASSGSVAKGGMAAPPVHLERALNGGPNPMAAVYYADVVARHPDLPAAARILDLGCGYGRIARALTTRLAPTQRYTGLDPHAESISWARREIEPAFPAFSFERIDLASGPYNPTGAVRGTDYRFPFDDGSVDVVLMTSVLTHVDFATVEHYLRESARVLAPAGRLIATMFLLDEEVDALIAAGRSRFPMVWDHGVSRVADPNDPELAIAHPRAAVLELLDEVGLEHRAVFDGSWCGRTGTHPLDFQDLVIAGRSARSTRRDDLERPGPSPAQAAAIDAALVRLGDVGVEGRERVVEFVLAAANVVLNALRWRRAGLDLAVERPGPRRPERFGLGLALATRFGLDRWTPPAGTDDRAVVVLPEDELIELVQSGGLDRTVGEALELLIETIDNGMLVLRAQRDGRRLVLGGRGWSAHPVAIPSMSP